MSSNYNHRHSNNSTNIQHYIQNCISEFPRIHVIISASIHEFSRHSNSIRRGVFVRLIPFTSNITVSCYLIENHQFLVDSVQKHSHIAILIGFGLESGNLVKIELRPIGMKNRFVTRTTTHSTACEAISHPHGVLAGGIPNFQHIITHYLR